MPHPVADFRSDTVTRPTPGMTAAMASAPLGDDVLCDDPTVQRLEAAIAERLGKEAALFVPSGTMSNLLGVKAHCRPGDEMICEANCHVFYYEQGGYAQIAGVAVRAITGDRGLLRLEQVESLVRPDDVHHPRTRLVTLENTHNRGGGSIQPYDAVEAICDWARRRGLATHLDGARLFNAAVATGIAARQWAGLFDTVSVCFSKGLGAPVGSALCGPKDLIVQARRNRKVLGGGMRQAGVLAAAALYALEHNIERLAVDHANAKRLVQSMPNSQRFKLDVSTVDTNMVFLEIDRAWGTAAEFAAELAVRGVLTIATDPTRVRLVTHLDVHQDDVARAVEAIDHIHRSRLGPA